MNLSQRLRTCAKHTGLDAVIELLTEAADEIDRLSAGKQADVTDERRAFEKWLGIRPCGAAHDLAWSAWKARADISQQPATPESVTGCNCRWQGDTKVQWCELHLAHKEAIHEWAERAKEAEKQLALRPERVPMTEEQIRSMCKQGWVFETVKQWVRIIEAHHGIKPKEQA